MKAKQRPFLAERRAKGQCHAKLAPSDREASAAGEAGGGGAARPSHRVALAEFGFCPKHNATIC